MAPPIGQLHWVSLPNKTSGRMALQMPLQIPPRFIVVLPLDLIDDLIHTHYLLQIAVDRVLLLHRLRHLHLHLSR